MSLFGSSFSDPYSGFPDAFDADEMRQQAMWRGIQQMGLNIMNPDPDLPPSLARSIGRGLSGFSQGADQGRQDYEQRGLTTLKMQEYQSAQATEKRKQEALTELLSDTDLDPPLRNWIMANPDHAWDVIKPQFEKPEDFTLSEGQTRYSGGKPVASVPKTAEKPTSAIQEYNFAKSQGYTGTFQQYELEMKKAGATAINTGPSGEDFGQPGTGLVWARDPQTRQIMLDEQGLPVAMPFKGGKAYEEKLAAELADKAAMQNKTQTDTIVLDEIDRALQVIDDHPWMAAGLVGGLTKNIGGSPAARVEELVIPILAVTGFAELGRMREASTSGASGLGQLTERELKYLQSVRGSLDIRQGSEQLAYNLKRLEAIYVAARDGRSILPEDDPRSGAYGRATIGPTLDDLEKELRRRGLEQ